MTRKIRIDMTGLRYGRLVAIDFSHSRDGHAHWLFACDCGSETIADGTAVRAGRTASCGCLHREISAARLTTHGYRAKQHHGPSYRAWQEIGTFCTNPRSSRYRDFGARGVVVSPGWRADFEAFLSDMGERPRGKMLARIDLNGNFEPGNCQWVAVRSRSQRAIDGKKRPACEPKSPAPSRPARRADFPAPAGVHQSV